MTEALPDLLPGAEPKFYRGDTVGCLVLHGFMAAPAEVGWLGDHLARQGHTVYVPRLTGHGIDPRHMRRIRWQDWYGQTLDGWHLLRQQCEQVVVIGHSMGGLLAALLAAAHPVTALVMAAAPVIAPDRLMPYTRALDPVMPWTTHPSEPELNAIIEAEQARRGEPVHSRVHYARWSTRAVYELYRMMAVVNAKLPDIHVPLLLLYAQQDPTATMENAEQIAARVSSQVIERQQIADGAHIMFQDTGREQAFRIVADFVNRQTCQ